MNKRLLPICLALICLVSTAGADFYVEPGLNRSDLLERTNRTTDCRANIAKTVCLVSFDGSLELGTIRPCEQGSKNYVAIFEQLYDHYPQSFQKWFCSLDHIFVERKFYGSAYAGLRRSESGVRAFVGIRQTILDERLSLEQWASWKEQTSFGGAQDQSTLYAVASDLPTHQVTTNIESHQALLAFLIGHELGHLFDFANEANRCLEPKPEPGKPCTVDPASWAGFSWKTSIDAKPAYDFALRSAFCFYFCKDVFLPKPKINEAYSQLFQKGNFISAYASRNPMEDFADNLAYFLLMEHYGAQYQLHTGNGVNYDISGQLKRLQNKHQFLSDFLQRHDLVYP